jgi:hypothetical protein
MQQPQLGPWAASHLDPGRANTRRLQGFSRSGGPICLSLRRTDRRASAACGMIAESVDAGRAARHCPGRPPARPFTRDFRKPWPCRARCLVLGHWESRNRQVTALAFSGGILDQPCCRETPGASPARQTRKAALAAPPPAHHVGRPCRQALDSAVRRLDGPTRRAPPLASSIRAVPTSAPIIASPQSNPLDSLTSTSEVGVGSAPTSALGEL